MAEPALTEWLLDADPAIRWQVRRDLLGERKSSWRADFHPTINVLEGLRDYVAAGGRRERSSPPKRARRSLSANTSSVGRTVPGASSTRG